MTVEKPDCNLPVFRYKFQGIFDASVFSELAVHTESEMMICTGGPLQSFFFW